MVKTAPPPKGAQVGGASAPHRTRVPSLRLRPKSSENICVMRCRGRYWAESRYVPMPLTVGPYWAGAPALHQLVFGGFQDDRRQVEDLPLLDADDRGAVEGARSRNGRRGRG